MTKARVVLTEDAREDVRDLDGSARVLVLKGLKKLETDPELRGQPLGKRLEANLTGYRKLIVGDRGYRVVYRVTDRGTVCVVMVVAKRADDQVYELAKARLSSIDNRDVASELSSLLERVRNI